MKIKICGLTRPEEAEYLNKYQADFAGMVLFFPKSRRNITIEQAEKIMEALDPQIRKVAVTVAPDEEQIRRITEAGFDYIQIHGEMPDNYREISDLPVLKALHCTELSRYDAYVSRPEIAGYVLDAVEPGSGKVFDWTLAEAFPRDEKLFFLAGGLNPENVREAIERLSPDGVDVSSGVEEPEKGGKSEERIREFIQQARSCRL